MQNSKPQISEKKRKKDLIVTMSIIMVIMLYIGLRYGWFYTQLKEATLLEAFVKFTENISYKPWAVFPANPVCVGIPLFVGAVICLFMYNKYLVIKDTVENAHGDASFETDYDQYEKEFVADPKIIEKEANIKMTSKNCPRNEEGKKIYTGLKAPYSGKYLQDVMEKCRQNAMIYTNTIYLSLNGSWCQRNTNSIVFGASGTGKSRYFLKPNILQANGSFICTDPSGDIMQECGYFLEHEKGYVVKCFNISDMTKSCRFNPLYYIRDTKDIPIIAQTFLDNMKGEGAKKGGDGDFWDKSAQALLCCTIGYLFEVCPIEQRNFSNVLELIRMDKHEEDEAGGTLSPFDELFQALGNANPTSYSYQQYCTYTQAPIKTRNNILISTSVNLQQLDIPEVKNLTYKDEMELDMLGEKNMAIFLNIPQADATYCWLTAMLYSLLFKRLYTYGEERMKKSAEDEANGVKDENGKPIKALSNPEMKVHVRFLIDECANVGKIPNLEKYLATCRKYRISIVPIFQNYSQIVEVYGKEKANNIVSNCDAFLFLGGSDEDTLKIIQGHLGKETVKTLSHSMSQSITKGSNSASKQQTGKDLMTRDQIETMSNAECLLFIRALRPFKTPKYKLERHPNYKYLSEGSEGKAFPNPFNLEYEDELIESVRVKQIGEIGYITPKPVDSARRRNMIAANKVKLAQMEDLLKDLQIKANTSISKEERTANEEQIEVCKAEIKKLKELLPPEDGGEVPSPTIVLSGNRRVEMGENLENQACEETKGANDTDSEAPRLNPDYSNVISAIAIGGESAAYEFDVAEDFAIENGEIINLNEPREGEEAVSDDELKDAALLVANSWASSYKKEPTIASTDNSSSEKIEDIKVEYQCVVDTGEEKSEEDSNTNDVSSPDTEEDAEQDYEDSENEYSVEGSIEDALDEGYINSEDEVDEEDDPTVAMYEGEDSDYSINY